MYDNEARVASAVAGPWVIEMFVQKLKHFDLVRPEQMKLLPIAARQLSRAERVGDVSLATIQVRPHRAHRTLVAKADQLRFPDDLAEKFVHDAK